MRSICRFYRLRHGDAELAEPQAEGLSADAQGSCGMVLIAVRELQDGREENAVDFAVRLVVYIGGCSAEALADESLEFKAAATASGRTTRRGWVR
jgi:hypothetical protein